LGLWPLVTLIFFEVSGGPFGTEDAVSAAGPLLTILGFLVFPVLWSVPEALITAELATAFPENSGYVAWVTAAFGPFWGFQEGLWSWMSGVTDNSLYPVMLAANLEVFFPQLAHGWPKYVFLVGMSLLLSGLNFRGLTVVGNAVITSTLAILVPFALLCVLCLPQIQLSNYTRVDLDKVDWSTFLNVMFWNLNYWDSVSTLAGEVRDPGRTFPRALLLAVVLVVAMYLLPTMAALGVPLLADGGGWKLGYYGPVAKQVGGPWLAAWIIVAAACSQVGQYQAEMASDSYQVQGMAERGFLPRALGRRSRYGTPVYGIVLSSLGVLCLAWKTFTEIVTMLNAIYCLAELLEFAAFVWLRIKRPDLPRPYRVPLPTWGLVVMLLPASALLVVVLAM
ncbi:amino acid carrier 4, partial [Volvox carteri f. nagariensis]